MGYADPLPTEASYAKSKKILAWWTDDHDDLLRKTIAEDEWIWYWSITDKICDITPATTIDDWREQDPLCEKYAWYNVIMYFAAARAKQLGLQRKIRKPIKKKCASCGEQFSEDSIPPSVVRHLKVNQIDVCLKCINGYFQRGKSTRRRSADQVKQWISRLVGDLQIIPPQSILTSLSVLTSMSTEERVKLLRLSAAKPSVQQVRRLFGTWLEALVEAGVLEDGSRETLRGTQCIANDGHVCLSFGEKTIDDFLSSRGVPHSKEPGYPGTAYRADFQIGDHLVEYFGLAGDEDYDRRAAEKKELAEQSDIPLISIYPDDLLSVKALERKLKPALNSVDP